jgi:general secretion pathway protein N
MSLAIRVPGVDVVLSWSRLPTVVLLLLALLCVGLAGVIYAELNGASEAADGSTVSRAVTPAAAKEADTSTFAMPPVQTFSAVTDRPLFAQTRRPAPQGNAESLGAWSDFTLAGIIIAPQSREVLIMHGKPPVLAHIQEGQDVDGWTVTSILPNRVVLQNGGTEHELKLVKSADPSPSSSDNGTARRRPNQ